MAAWLEWSDESETLSSPAASVRLARAPAVGVVAGGVRRDAEQERVVSPTPAAVDCWRPTRMVPRPGVRCNNWLEPEGAGDDGEIPARHKPHVPSGGRGGSNRPLGASWCHSRPMQETADASFESVSPEASSTRVPPSQRQRSPAGSEVDEPLISPAEHGYISNGQPLWRSALSGSPDAADYASNNGHDYNCSAVGASNGNFRAMVLPVDERFIIRRNGKWYRTAARISITTRPQSRTLLPSVHRCLD